MPRDMTSWPVNICHVNITVIKWNWFKRFEAGNKLKRLHSIDGCDKHYDVVLTVKLKTP